jgi:hypothetical protein
LISWPADGIGNAWVHWGCFDQLLRPRRIAATNLSDHGIEVYAIAQGRLEARQLHDEIAVWSPWSSLSLPSASGAQDIAALGYPQVEETELYLAGDSQLYRRQRFSSDPYATLGPWTEFADEALRAVAVGLTPEGERWVVGVTASGELLATNSESNENVAMSTFGSIGDGAIDIAAGYEADLALFFLAAAVDGGVWRRDMPSGDDEWHQLKGAQPPKIQAITVASSSGNAPFLFAVSEHGEVSRSEDGSSWTLME